MSAPLLRAQDQVAARRWAAALLACGEAVILDSETTGLDRWAEVVQLAVVDLSGAPLLTSLVRPTRPIPPSATAIHGLTDVDVAQAPRFVDLVGALTAVLQGREVVIYNVRYDLRVLMACVETAGRPPAAFAAPAPLSTPVLFGVCRWTCAMTWYAQFVGEWSTKTRSYRNHPLPGGDHSALGDALATLRLIRHMAGERVG